MKNWKIKTFSRTLALVLLASSFTANAHDSGADVATLQLQNLMRATLEGVTGTEVIVSRVSIPANTMLPVHWHPGEEFAYILEGTVSLLQKGKKELVGHKGDVMKVPLKQIHTAKTGEESAVILVFRVHEAGQPERVKAEM
ncbi:MAG: cupin domain-containing protein [Gammaproteobacteria bacterium]|nr:cupin domain-containing protein [Gammaproteobacteria bacterium]